MYKISTLLFSLLGSLMLAIGQPSEFEGALNGSNASRLQPAGELGDRSSMGQGGDMRSSSSGIEKSDMVRGIQSMQYINLTRSFQAPERRIDAGEVSATYVADIRSSLYHLSRGFGAKPSRLTWNVDAAYLTEKEDLRSVVDNYRCLTLSAGFAKRWNLPHSIASLSYRLDYSGFMNDGKNSLDLNGSNDATAKFRSDYNRYSTSFTLDVKPKRSNYIRSMSLSGSAAMQFDYVSRTDLLQVRGDTLAAIVAAEEGNAVILPNTYTAVRSSQGQPLSEMAKAKALLTVQWLPKGYALKVGVDWQSGKSYGRLQSHTANPAMHSFTLSVEESARVRVGKHSVSASASVLGMSIFHLPKGYALSGQMYFDPRLNVRWTFPSVSIWGQRVSVGLSGSMGRYTRMPSLSQLYPSVQYVDGVQYDNLHASPDHRRLSLTTYALDLSNPSLKPSHTFKRELRADVGIGGNKISTTYFVENVTSGFRSTALYNTYALTKLDASAAEALPLASSELLNELPFATAGNLRGFAAITNGSRTYKRGIRYSVSSAPITSIRTRLAVSGSWQKMHYESSQPTMKRLSVVVDGVQQLYVGIYDDNNGYVRENASTTFSTDTNLPSLGLAVSASVQYVWLIAQRSMRKDGTPLRYVDSNSVVHSFSNGGRPDPMLRLLMTRYSESQFARRTAPSYAIVNVRAAKQFLHDRLSTALVMCNVINYSSNNALVSKQKSVRVPSSSVVVELNVRI